MKKLATLSAIIGVSLCPCLASAQTAGPVSLILVTWVQAKTAAEAQTAPGLGTTAQSIIGSFNDLPTCVAAAKKALMSDGATALAFNFICVPNR
jgi:hypothetical protein